MSGEDEKRQEQSKPEHDLIQRLRAGAKGSWEADAVRKEKYVDKTRIYRLELIYDETSKSALLQGNQAGFEALRDNCAMLSEAEAGTILYFDEVTSLTKTNIRLIVKRVNDSD
jgi:hypothetical protein